MQQPQINIPDYCIKEGVHCYRNTESALESSFVQIVVGKPGSGKTFYIDQLLTNPSLYHKKFDFHIIVSPSDFPNIKQSAANFHKTLDVSWIYNKLNQIREQKLKDINVLLILDDVVSSIKDLEKDQLINNLFLNRRHLIPNCTISILVATQKYNLIPLRFRTVATSLVLFDINNKEFECIRGEHFKTNQEAQEIKKQLQQITAIPYNFVFIRLTPHLMFFNKFEKVLLSTEIISKFVNDMPKLQNTMIQRNQVQQTAPLQATEVLRQISQEPLKTIQTQTGWDRNKK